MPGPNQTVQHECRPGERIVAGKPYVFDAELLNNHLAEQAVADAPADLSSLDDSALASLSHSCGRLWALNQGAEGPWTALSLRVNAERKARDQREPRDPVILRTMAAFADVATVKNRAFAADLYGMDRRQEAQEVERRCEAQEARACALREEAAQIEASADVRASIRGVAA